jgi:uncharacterized protein (UPF0332 family)/predicted nucleotidyltransferase
MGKKVRPARLLREERVPYLTDRERAAVGYLLERLEAECADDVYRVVLFGSKARGDHVPGSDLDVLVVADDEQRLHSVARAVADETGIPLQLLVVPPQRYREYRRLRVPLYVNLRRDGIELWDEARWVAEERTTPLDFAEGERRRMDENTKKTIRIYVERSHHNLEAVGQLRDWGYLDVALSRAYYACFYALTAALYAVNVVRGKHAGVQAALSQFLVKPGLIEEEYKDIYSALKTKREESDYGPRFVPDPDEATELLDDAKRFVARMEAFLREQGALQKV